MVYMMLFNLLFLFRKMEKVLEGGLDLVQPPNMAHSLLYSTNYANSRANKSEKRSNKMRFLLDFTATPCYNTSITIEKGKKLAKT